MLRESKKINIARAIAKKRPSLSQQRPIPMQLHIYKSNQERQSRDILNNPKAHPSP
jgi:hypothetical protein